MIKPFGALAIVACGLLSGMASAAPLPHVAVEVFHDAATTITGAEAARLNHSHVIVVNVVMQNLDAPALLEDELSLNLPVNPQEAERVAVERWQEFMRNSGQLRLQQAFEPMNHAFLYGIEKLPAIVFEEGAYVVYGVTDVDIALIHYLNYRQNNHHEVRQ